MCEMIYICGQIKSYMPRPKNFRFVSTPPKMLGYKPFGIPRVHLDTVKLQFDEYESIRLLDYEGLNQEEAAVKMNISRPTLTRVYESARRNIAKAFVEGKMILIEGGEVKFSSDWYRCKKCYKLIEGLNNHVKCSDCECYGDDELKHVNE